MGLPGDSWGFIISIIRPVMLLSASTAHSLSLAHTLVFAVQLVCTPANAQTNYPSRPYPSAANPSLNRNPQPRALTPKQPPYALRFDGRYAEVPITFPRPILQAVYAANTLQGKPYRMGGGHSKLYDSAYDCSGSTSFILFQSGLLRTPMNSKEFANFGLPGPGRFITLYVKPGDHVFLTICGLRLDTTGGREGEGPRWRPSKRSTSGFQLRHPPGL